MTKFTKVSIALTTIGGALMMATPMAFASTSVSSNQFQFGGGPVNESASASVGSISSNGNYSNTTYNPSYSQSIVTTGGLTSSTTTSGSQWAPANSNGYSQISADGYTSTGGSVSTNQSATGGWATQEEGVNGNSGSLNIKGYQTQTGPGTFNQSFGGSVGSTSADDHYTSNVHNPTLSSSTYTLDSKGNYVSQQTSNSSGGSSYIKNGDDYNNSSANLSASQNAVIGSGTTAGNNGYQNQYVVASTGALNWSHSKGQYEQWSSKDTGASVGQNQYVQGNRGAGGTFAQNASANAGNTTAEHMKYGGSNGNSSQTYTTPANSEQFTSVGGSQDVTVNDFSNPTAGYTADQTASGSSTFQQQQGDAGLQGTTLNEFWGSKGLG